MSRSVVLNATARCPRCGLTSRWCICAAHADLHSPFELALMTHKRELFRPSSTGNLIARLFREARRHTWHPEEPLRREQVVGQRREVWVLHPNGLPAPANVAPQDVQVLMLDGSWSESAGMARTVTAWGRLVQLPLAGTSRFWLRAKQEGGRYSTAEALLFLLETFGLTAQHDALRVQFELHVYANLRARQRRPGGALPGNFSDCRCTARLPGAVAYTPSASGELDPAGRDVQLRRGRAGRVRHYGRSGRSTVRHDGPAHGACARA